MMKYLNLGLKLALVPVLMVAYMGMTTPAAEAGSKSPFVKLKGKWRGGGRVTPPGGQSEKVRCRVSYSVFASGNKAKQRIRCAGNGYWITATSNLRYTPGTKKIRGTWHANYGDRRKPKKKTGGAVQGDYIGNVLSISLISEKYTGGMSIHMQGRRQKVVINSLAVLNLRR